MPATRRSRSRRQWYGVLPAPAQRLSTVVRLVDSTTRECSVAQLLRMPHERGAGPQHARLAHQFVQANREALDLLEIRAEPQYTGEAVTVLFTSGATVGAVPLVCPCTKHYDRGVVVEPRFGWSGVGPPLAATGWRVAPTILRMPLLPKSDRDVPPWVIATAVLARVEALLRTLTRRFDLVEDILPAPRGRPLWTRYAVDHLARGRPDRVPCRYVELGTDHDLLGALHYVLARQQASLEAVAKAGSVAAQVLRWCVELRRKVEHVPARCPTARQLTGWLHAPMSSTVVADAVEAMEWTIEERGMAGLSELRGLPWRMSMDQFWETWVETVAARLAHTFGGRLLVARRQQTTVPLSWDPPYVGSQRSLKPDVVWQRENETVILDAKYKQHWTELSGTRWHNLDDIVREHHRADILQVLAYGNLPDTPSVSLVLAYPCPTDLWKTLVDQGRTWHAASVPAGRRRVRLVLYALPLEPSRLGRAADELMASLQPR